MSRWRDIKQGKKQEEKSSNLTLDIEQDIENNASILSRIKAFITDMFMIMMPIMYITTYIILAGKDDFQSSEMSRWLTSLIFGIITIAFWVYKGQTPGLKAYDIKIVDSKTNNNIKWGKAILRYIMFLISAISIVGILLPFFRKDKRTFQDLASSTSVINFPNK